jgi:hypothetical protein
MVCPSLCLSQWPHRHRLSASGQRSALLSQDQGEETICSLPLPPVSPLPRLASSPQDGKTAADLAKERSKPECAALIESFQASLLLPPRASSGLAWCPCSDSRSGHQKESKLAAENNIVAALARAREGDGTQPGPLPPPPPAPAVAAPVAVAAPNQQTLDPVVGPRPHGPREEETKSTETQTDLDINSESESGGDASSQLPLLLQLLSEMVTLLSISPILWPWPHLSAVERRTEERDGKVALFSHRCSPPRPLTDRESRERS